MSQHNWMGGLTREIHHVKLMRDGEDTYEPTMVIRRNTRPGRSFMIPIDCLWRYVEPSQNMDRPTRKSDLAEFKKLVFKANEDVRNARLVETRSEAARKLKRLADADVVSRRLKLLLSTSYSLLCGMELLEIPSNPVSVIQFLTWIQDRLDDLREFPEHSQDENIGVCGEVTLWEGTTKIGTKELHVTETDVLYGCKEDGV